MHKSRAILLQYSSDRTPNLSIKGLFFSQKDKILYYSNSLAGGSPKKTVIEGKKAVSAKTTISEMSQCIAMALIFARIQRKRHHGLHKFPTLRVLPKGIDIILYNTVSDHLLLSLAWTNQVLFMLWLVLPHNVFSFQELPKKYKRYTSGFLDYIANSGATRIEPKYLVFRNSFEFNEEEIPRENRVTSFF